MNEFKLCLRTNDIEKRLVERNEVGSLDFLERLRDARLGRNNIIERGC